VLFALLGDGKQFGPFYTLLSLTTCLVVGTSVMPNLLVEEKETKTLRMLLVSPASLADVVAGKLLVGLVYQVLLGMVVLVVQRAFVGKVSLVLLFLLLGSCLGIAVGLLIGSIFKSVTSGGAFTGVIALLYIFPALFVGPFSQFFQSATLARLMPALPTYYLADGLLVALQDRATPAATLVDASIVLLTALIFSLAAVWILWRQARVAGSL
jgi:ABC-2 type transport system permease protein